MNHSLRFSWWVSFRQVSMIPFVLEMFTFFKLEDQIGVITERGNVSSSEALGYRSLELREKLRIRIFTTIYASAALSWRFISIGNCINVITIKNLLHE